MALSYFLCFLIAAQRIRKKQDVYQFVRWITLSTILMAAFGILQYYTSNGLFFWFYDVPFTSTDSVAKGSFTCRNHYAHFLVLGLAPLVSWLALLIRQFSPSNRNCDRKKYPALIACLVVALSLIIFGVLLSRSRGGALMLMLSICLTLILNRPKGSFSHASLFGVTSIGIVSIGLLSPNDYQSLSSRIDDFTAGSLDELDSQQGRRKIWAANCSAIAEGSWFGSGAGSHPSIYPVYMKEHINVQYVHAENGYLQIVTETGFIGGGLLLLALCTLIYWGWKALRLNTSPKDCMLATNAIVGLIVSATHSLFDFVWYTPSCMTIALLFAACLFRMSQQQEESVDKSNRGDSSNRLTWIAATGLVSISVLWILGTLVGPARASLHKDTYQLIANQHKRQNNHQLQSGGESPAIEEEKLARFEAMSFLLRKANAYDSLSAKTHLQLASTYIQWFNHLQKNADNSMTLNQIKEAALASSFESGKELCSWLEKAIGGHYRLLYQARYHTLRSLQLSPLSGRAYIYLSELCFLTGQTKSDAIVYLEQSLLTNPSDGKVLFRVGRDYINNQRGEEAIALWKRAFKNPGNHQSHIIQLMANGVSLSAFLQEFQPDWQTLPTVWKAFSRSHRNSDLQVLLTYADQKANSDTIDMTEKEAALVWFQLANMHIDVHQTIDAIATLERSLTYWPEYYLARRTLAKQYLIAKRFKEAEDHLQWCKSRKPEDVSLKNALEIARRSQLDSRNRNIQ